eukprot:TRINITY_DN6847_c2_g2_i2.p1 TRINITY_DN6847_c2_g2~~TRINITY_DN6847_c2_g2_i2.p1  ORF type:complete len:469 (-),score=71.40 TRINITY_DN6847_c2_g2_i2:176-1582(-)
MTSGSFHIARALLDYEGEGPHDLPLRSGELVLVSQRDEVGWWVGVARGEVGLVPENFLQIYTEVTVGGGMDKVGMDKVGMDKVGMDKVGMDKSAEESSGGHGIGGAFVTQEQRTCTDESLMDLLGRQDASVVAAHAERLQRRLADVVAEAHGEWIARAEQEQQIRLLDTQLLEAREELSRRTHHAHTCTTHHAQLHERLGNARLRTARARHEHDLLRTRADDLRARIHAEADHRARMLHAHHARHELAHAQLHTQRRIHTDLHALRNDLLLELRRLRPNAPHPDIQPRRDLHQDHSPHQRSTSTLIHTHTPRSTHASTPRSTSASTPTLTATATATATATTPRSSHTVQSSGWAWSPEGQRHASDLLHAGLYQTQDQDQDEDQDEDEIPYVSQRDIQVVLRQSGHPVAPSSLEGSQFSPYPVGMRSASGAAALATPRSVASSASARLEGELYRAKYPHRTPKSPSTLH